MIFNFVNLAGEEFQVEASHWRVYLSSARAYGWKPAGTQRPNGYPKHLKWSNQYTTNDGQFVVNEDARYLAQFLHSLAVQEQFPKAVADMINQSEPPVRKGSRDKSGEVKVTSIMTAREVAALVKFLYNGGFFIR